MGFKLVFDGAGQASWKPNTHKHTLLKNEIKGGVKEKRSDLFWKRSNSIYTSVNLGNKAGRKRQPFIINGKP